MNLGIDLDLLFILPVSEDLVSLIASGGKELFTHFLSFFKLKIAARRLFNCTQFVFSTNYCLSSYVLPLQLTVFLLPNPGSKDSQAKVCIRNSCCSAVHTVRALATFAHAVT